MPTTCFPCYRASIFLSSFLLSLTLSFDLLFWTQSSRSPSCFVCLLSMPPCSASHQLLHVWAAPSWKLDVVLPKGLGLLIPGLAARPEIFPPHWYLPISVQMTFLLACVWSRNPSPGVSFTDFLHGSPSVFLCLGMCPEYCSHQSSCVCELTLTAARCGFRRPLLGHLARVWGRTVFIMERVCVISGDA